MLLQQVAVAIDNLDGYSAILKCRKSGAGARLGWIEKARKTREYQFRLVIDDGMRMVRRNLSPRDAQYAESLIFQDDMCGLLQDPCIVETIFPLRTSR